VGEEDPIHALEAMTNRVLAMIGTAIKQKEPLVARSVDERNRCTRTRASIARIIRRTDAAIAANHGNACGSPRSKQKEADIADDRG
jgi:hypothetical protein